MTALADFPGLYCNSVLIQELLTRVIFIPEIFVPKKKLKKKYHEESRPLLTTVGKSQILTLLVTPPWT